MLCLIGCHLGAIGSSIRKLNITFTRSSLVSPCVHSIEVGDLEEIYYSPMLRMVRLQ